MYEWFIISNNPIHTCRVMGYDREHAKKKWREHWGIDKYDYKNMVDRVRPATEFEKNYLLIE